MQELQWTFCSETGLMPVMIEPEETDVSSVDGLLEAIERETTLRKTTGANFENTSHANQDKIAEGSEDASDPGVSEGERKRNTRLSELLRLLSPLLDCATKMVGKEAIVTAQCHRRFAEAVVSDAPLNTTRLLCVHEAKIGTSKAGLVSVPYHSRIIDALLKTMEIARRPEDASPLRIAEMPGLITASTTLRLII